MGPRGPPGRSGGRVDHACGKPPAGHGEFRLPRVWQALAKRGTRKLLPNAALARAQSISEPKLREQALSSAIDGLTEIDPARALEELHRLPSPKSRLVDRVYRARYEGDPRAAAEAYLSTDLLGQYYRVGRVNGILEGWMKTDPEAALEWHDANALHLRSGERREMLLSWIKSDATAALERVLDHHNLRQRSDLLQIAAGYLYFEESPESAMAVIEQELKPHERSQAIESIVYRSLGTSFNANEMLPLVNELPLPKFNGIAGRFANQWASIDGPAAMAWLESVPSSTALEAYPEAMLYWAQQDPKAAAAYLQEMEAGEVKVKTANKTLDRILMDFKEPEQRLEWLKGLDSETQAAVQSTIRRVEEDLK
jgi:hypothetical protein